MILKSYPKGLILLFHSKIKTIYSANLKKTVSVYKLFINT